MNTLLGSQQQIKQPKILAEECFQITPVTFCRSMLRPLDSSFGDDNVGKYGDKVLKKSGVKLTANYQVDLELAELFLQFSAREFSIGGWQHIQLGAVPSNLGGERPYFICDCGRRVNKLYMPTVAKKRWQCAKCHNITWEVKRFNKRTATGALGHFLNRHLKLQEMERQVKRIDYGGQFTRRARSVIQLIKKWSPGFVLRFQPAQTEKAPAKV